MKIVMFLLLALVYSTTANAGLIWNETTQSHDIKVDGVIVSNFTPPSALSLSTNEQIKTAKKLAIDADLSSKGYEIHIHIIDKATKQYVIMKSPAGYVPEKEWWKSP